MKVPLATGREEQFQRGLRAARAGKPNPPTPGGLGERNRLSKVIFLHTRQSNLSSYANYYMYW
jgi:hypothetical protein